jgi:hypothetical protein
MHSGHVVAGESLPIPAAAQAPRPLHKRINLISAAQPRTPNPPGWEPYDGSVYTEVRGYGWLSDRPIGSWDRGERGTIVLFDGTRTSPRTMNRRELANWQGAHQENRLLVFRIDLPDGWYRVTCTSVDPIKGPLPLVDQRSIKCRAHDVVFAGPTNGAPLKIEGNRLVEGSAIVEVTEGHLRVVVGDPAYGGWTWSYQGPWYRGWHAWFGKLNHQRYAEIWYQKLTRTVDPGYHNLRLNSLEIERLVTPAQQSPLLFRDLFNRDDSPDLNGGLPATHHWSKVELHPAFRQPISSELYKTAIKLTGPVHGRGIIGLLQKGANPQEGTVRYSTRVSLYTGAGSQLHSGIQEAGLLILVDLEQPIEFHSTFLGVAFDSSRPETPGWVRYRVGDREDGYRTNADIPDTILPFKITEGEYEIIVEHDIDSRMLKHIRINGEDLTAYWTPADRRQPVSGGQYGLRALMDAHRSGVSLQQFYWYYRVENVSSRH